MTKQNEQEALGTAMNKTEMFFEKNSKSMIIALLVGISMGILAAVNKNSWICLLYTSDAATILLV